MLTTQAFLLLSRKFESKSGLAAVFAQIPATGSRQCSRYSMLEPAVTTQVASSASITEPTYTRPVLRNA